MALYSLEDLAFYKKTKKGKEPKRVEAPQLEVPLADSHAHFQQLPDPVRSLVQAALHGLDSIAMVVDIVEEGTTPIDALEGWLAEARTQIDALSRELEQALPTPKVSIILGCHPHNAHDYTHAAELQLAEALTDKRVVALGEIGLDYHYDFSTPAEQKECFRSQIRLAKQLRLPLVLHLREAHEDALHLLDDEGFPSEGTLLHCCTIGPEELQPWLDRDCYVAFGGAITFASSDAIRQSAELVPAERLLLETDCPYMAPVPLRGERCTPAMIVFTAQYLTQLRCPDDPAASARLLRQIHDNTRRFFGEAS